MGLMTFHRIIGIMLIRRTGSKAEATEIDELINILRFDDSLAVEWLA